MEGTETVCLTNQNEILIGLTQGLCFVCYVHYFTTKIFSNHNTLITSLPSPQPSPTTITKTNHSSSFM